MSHVVASQEYDKLKAIVSEELKRTQGASVVHAGHYFLEVVDNMAIDHLNNPESAKEAFRNLIAFSRITWELACQSIVECNAQLSSHLVILVNDWQYFIPKVADRRSREREAVRLRRQYYASIPSVPAFHLSVMESYGLTLDRILPASQETWLFSESWLRTRFAKTITGIMNDPTRASQLGLSLQRDENEQPTISAQVEGQEFPLLYCGNSNCAGEVVELLKRLYDGGTRSFINLYPGECRRPVEQGTETARQIFGLEGMEVVNIAVQM